MIVTLEGSLPQVSSLHHGGFRDQSQVTRLGDTSLYLLSHVTSPANSKVALSCTLDCWSIIHLIPYMPLTKKSYPLFVPTSVPQERLCVCCMYTYVYRACTCVSRLLSPLVFWGIVYHYTQNSSTGLDLLTSQLRDPVSQPAQYWLTGCATAPGCCVGTGGIWTQNFSLAWQAIYQLSTKPTHSSDWLCDSLHTETQLFFKH